MKYGKYNNKDWGFQDNKSSDLEEFITTIKVDLKFVACFN